MRLEYLLTCSLCACGGVLLGMQKVSLGSQISFIVSISLFLVSFFILLIRIHHLKKSCIGAGVSLLLFIFFFLRTLSVQEMTPDIILVEHIGSTVDIKGEVVSEVSNRNNSTQATVEVHALLRDNIWNTLDQNTRVLIRSPLYGTYEYGDIVHVRGKMKIPEDFETDYSRTFEYRNYLRKDDIFYTMSFVQLKILEKKETTGLYKNLLQFKNSFLSSLNKNIPHPESALAGGILLGVKQSLGKNIEKVFVDTGLIHIVVLSGFNVVIIVKFFEYILGFFLSRKYIFWPTVIAIILFVLLVGAQPPVLRASIMGIIGLLAFQKGSRYDIVRALIFAGLIMVAINPRILLWDVSFQLSFLATLGLIFLSPVVERWFRWIASKKLLPLKEALVATVCAQIAVLPFLLWKIGLLSTIAPLANALVIPFIAPAMAASFVVGLVGMFSGILASIVAVPTTLLLSGVVNLASLLASLPFATFEIVQFPLWFMFLCYAGIITWMYLWNTKNPT